MDKEPGWVPGGPEAGPVHRGTAGRLRRSQGAVGRIYLELGPWWLEPNLVFHK